MSLLSSKLTFDSITLELPVLSTLDFSHIGHVVQPNHLTLISFPTDSIIDVLESIKPLKSLTFNIARS